MADDSNHSTKMMKFVFRLIDMTRSQDKNACIEAVSWAIVNSNPGDNDNEIVKAALAKFIDTNPNLAKFIDTNPNACANATAKDKTNLDTDHDDKTEAANSNSNSNNNIDVDAAISAASAAASLSPDKELLDYFESKSNISMDDIQIAIKVLNTVSSLAAATTTTTTNDNDKKRKRKSDNNNGTNNDKLLKLYRTSKVMRPFRKSVIQCHQKVCAPSMWDGHSSKEDFQKYKLDQQTLKRRKLAETNMQRKHIENTQLRRGRIDKLNSKLSEGQNEEEMKMQRMMIPDGHVDTMSSKPISLALENGSAAAVVITVLNDEDSNNNDEEKIGDEETKQQQPSNKNATSTTTELPKLRSCYVCKTRFRELHTFYDQLCPECASLNYTKRHENRNLAGYTAVVTGSRVKIGYQTCLKLLRAGCYVIATTRFPNSAVDAYRKEKDFDDWKDQLDIYGLDLRDVTGLELFCRYLQHKLHDSGGLDILINNACQTIRRPTAYYIPQINREKQLWNRADHIHKSILKGCREYELLRQQLHQSSNGSSGKGGSGGGDATNNILTNGNSSSSSSMITLPLLEMENTSASTTTKDDTRTTTSSNTNDNVMVLDDNDNNNDRIVVTTKTTPFETSGMSHSAASSQMVLCKEDVGLDDSVLPKGLSDINNQQLDLRKTNSWLLKMDQISTPELMECMFVNAIAPFVLNSKLQPLLMKRRNDNTNNDIDDKKNNTDNTIGRNRYIVNVSAMEGKFYRFKMANHPHTNMAKSALNMMTRTAAEDLALQHQIYMNSIDTGWINDENPLERASKTAAVNNFQTPIDEIDAASRILDPIMTNSKVYGKFLKDYRETEW